MQAQVDTPASPDPSDDETDTEANAPTLPDIPGSSPRIMAYIDISSSAPVLPEPPASPPAYINIGQSSPPQPLASPPPTSSLPELLVQAGSSPRPLSAPTPPSPAIRYNIQEGFDLIESAGSSSLMLNEEIPFQASQSLILPEEISEDEF